MSRKLSGCFVDSLPSAKRQRFPETSPKITEVFGNRELFLKILQLVHPQDLVRCHRVCRLFDNFISANLGRLRKFKAFSIQITDNPLVSFDLIADEDDASYIRYATGRYLLQGPDKETKSKLKMHICVRDFSNKRNVINFGPNMELIGRKGRIIILSAAPGSYRDFAFMPSLLRKIVERFEVADLLMDHHKFHDLTKFLPDLTILSFSRVVQVSVDEVCEALRGSKIMKLEMYDVPQEGGLFSRPEVEQLQFVSAKRGFMPELDDKRLKELNKLKHLYFLNWRGAETGITLKGLQAVLEEFNKGEREIEQIGLQLPSWSGNTSEEVRNQIHKCSNLCFNGMHRFGRPGSHEIFSLNVTSMKDEWVVEIVRTYS